MDKPIVNIRKPDWISILNSVAWMLLSVTFIASGILKGVAVKGFIITVREFLDLLGLETLQPYSVLLAIAICVCETAIGMLVLFKRLRPILSLIYPVILSFFTIITYINLTDMYGGLESCGCFGEIIHLNPMETFAKNLVLFGISLYVLSVNFIRTHAPCIQQGE